MRNLSTRLLLAATLTVFSSTAGAQNHVYNFNNSLADAFAGPSLVADGGTLSASGYSFGANQGLSLSSVFSGGASYSIAIRSYFDNVSSWRKMVDYKDRTSDNGYYNFSSQSVFYPVIGGPGGTYAANVLAMTVITRDAGSSLVSVYVNGGSQYAFYDYSGYGDFTAASGLARFFEDDYPTGQNESGSGFVDYIATYDHALTAQEVADLTVVVGVPEPASIVLLGTGLLGVVGFARRRRKTV